MGGGSGCFDRSLASGSLGTNNIIVGTNGLMAAIETIYDVNDHQLRISSLGANGEMFPNQNDHFASVTAMGLRLANGVYSFATLNSTYPANFGFMDDGKMAPRLQPVRARSSVWQWPAFVAAYREATSVLPWHLTISISATNGSVDGPWTFYCKAPISHCLWVNG